MVATWWWWSWLTVAGARAAPTKRNVSSIKINYKGRTVHTVQGGLGSSSKVKRGDRAISQRLAPSSGRLTPKEQYQHFSFPPPHLCLVLLIRHSAAPLPPQSLNKLQQTRRQLCRMINCHLITPLPYHIEHQPSVFLSVSTKCVAYFAATESNWMKSADLCG